MCRVQYQNMSQDKISIDLWDDGLDSTPIEDFLSNLQPVSVSYYVAQKLIYYRQHTITQLRNNRQYLEEIRGIDDPQLWELKFYSHPHCRAICLVGISKIVILEMFMGSGSGGRVSKFTPKAIERARSWLDRFPQFLLQ